MGRRMVMLICNDCYKKGVKDEYADRPGEFWIPLEWMDKDELIEYLKGVKCPVCGSDNWTITDASEL